MLLTALFTPKPKDQWGSRLSNLNVPSVSPGSIIPRVWGRMKIPATMIYAGPLSETMHTHQASKKGGKGMFGGNSARSFSFTYSIDAAWAVCTGPIYSVNRIWANQKLLWASPQSQANEQAQFDAAYQAEATRLIDEEDVSLDYAAASAFVFAWNNFVSSEVTLNTPAEALAYILSHPIDDTAGLFGAILTPNSANVSTILGQLFSGLNNQSQYQSQINCFDNLEIYLGTAGQTPNALLEGYLGQGNAPSFRNVVYFVITNLQLMDFGNAVPSLTAEIQVNAAGDTTLVEICTSVCIQAGLTTDQFDAVSNVDPKPFPGFAVSGNISAREILMELQKVFPIDTAESGDKVVFNMLNTRARQVIQRGDLAAHQDSEPVPDLIETTIASDYDLPQRINLKFQEPARSFSPNTIYAARYNTPSSSIEDLDVTIALDRSDAQTYVSNLLANRLLARRTYKMTVPRKYITMEAADSFKMPNKFNPAVLDGYYCTEVHVGANGLLEIHAVDHSYTDQSLAPTDTQSPDLDVAIGGNAKMPTTCPTIGYLFDGPLMLDNSLDQPGFYVILAGLQNQWQGGQMQVDAASPTIATAYGETFVSPSAGSQWSTVGQSSINVPVGVVMNQLAPDVVGSYWDDVSVLTVKIYNGMDLSAANPDDMLSQTLNATLIGNEVVMFANVVDKGNGVYQLSKFLRGLRGTENQINNHVVSERFVRLTSAMLRVMTTRSEMNVSDMFQFQSLLAANTGVTPFSFTNSGNSYRPYTVAVYQRFRDVSGDVTLSWWPRVRQNGAWTSGTDVTMPTNDNPESYEIDICTDASDTTVVKTYTVTGALGASFTYTAAMQITDLGSAHNPVFLVIYQMSQIVGRGFGLGVTV